ncbi:MAG: hypothetical protein ACRD4I_05165, partial [Candidatus Angelobacter sp.]
MPVTNGGLVGVGAAGGVLLNTPVVTFTAPPTTTGISLSDRAGISQNAASNAATETMAGSGTIYNYPAEMSSESGNFEPPSAASSQPMADLGPSYFAGAGPVNGAEAMAAASLGEVASKYKAVRPSQNVRTYTNADVQRMDQTMNLRGENINARLASEPPQNTPAANMQPQIAGPSGTKANPGQATQPQLYAGARPSPAIREDQSQNPANSNAQAQSSGATTPQMSQPKPGN